MGGMAKVASNAVQTTEVSGVNPATGLASDYLNHFYEPLLLLEHVGDDPDLLDDLAAWSPNSYIGHFGQSGRSDLHSVLAAYRNAQPVVRRRLDNIASEAGQATATALQGLVHTARDGGNISKVAQSLAQMLRRYIHMLDSIIHGRDQDSSPTAGASLGNH